LVPASVSEWCFDYQQVSTEYPFLEHYGRGAGIGCFDHEIVMFAEHLVRLQQPAEALRAVERARPHSEGRT